MTVHKDQVASVLTRAVQSVLARGLNDPRVRGLMSVTRVIVSDDLENATVMISVLPTEHAELTVHGLRHASQHIRTEVGKRIRIRRMPRLEFRLDQSLKIGGEVIAAIDRAMEVDRERAEARSDSAGTEEEES